MNEPVPVAKPEQFERVTYLNSRIELLATIIWTVVWFSRSRFCCSQWGWYFQKNLPNWWSLQPARQNCHMSNGINSSAVIRRFFCWNIFSIVKVADIQNLGYSVCNEDFVSSLRCSQPVQNKSAVWPTKLIEFFVIWLLNDEMGNFRAVGSCLQLQVRYRQSFFCATRALPIKIWPTRCFLCRLSWENLPPRAQTLRRLWKRGDL